MYLGRPGIQTKTVIAGIRGITPGVADALPVVIDSAGQLGPRRPPFEQSSQIAPRLHRPLLPGGLRSHGRQLSSRSERCPECPDAGSSDRLLGAVSDTERH